MIHEEKIISDQNNLLNKNTTYNYAPNFLPIKYLILSNLRQFKLR